MPETPSHERLRFVHFYNNVRSFVHDTLSGDLLDIKDYVSGTQRFDFFPDHTTGDTTIEDHCESIEENGGLSYEEALFSRLLTPRPFNMLVLVGGLGSGKSTAITYLIHLLETRRQSIAETFPCNCTPCTRRPMRINCVTIPRETSADAAIVDVLHRIRFAVYHRLISEWLNAAGIDPAAVNDFDPGYKVLRRLIFTNDLEQWADRDHPGDFPLALEVADCKVEAPLLSRRPTLENLRELHRRFRAATEGLASRLKAVQESTEAATGFTSLLLRFYAARCRKDKPSNLLVVDNLDQLPTEVIERISDRLSVVASQTPYLPLIVPLRPSSLAPLAFERRPAYMYHYGPNCFELVLSRLQKLILNRAAASLRAAPETAPLPQPPSDYSASAGLQDRGTTPLPPEQATGGAPPATDDAPALPRVFQRRPTDDELYAFLVATFLYSKILTAGMGPDAVRLSGGASRVPVVHPEFSQTLGALKLGEGALRSLSETLGALVGTCARYATVQLENYYHSVYHAPEILQRALRSGISRGATSDLAIRYGEMVYTMLLQPPGPEATPRLLNLYKPTFRGPNPQYPSLAKIRALQLLEQQQRLRVVDVVRNLGYFGIPRDVTLAALNELHDKQRLLVWFSKNTNVHDTPHDLEQSVVISEHGLSYIRHVLGDFEYIWFCARQIPEHPSLASPQNFRARLEEYTRLVESVAHTEWKQLAFRNSLQTTIPDEDELSAVLHLGTITLTMLYSSLERALTSSLRSFGRSKAATPYAEAIAMLTTQICSLILRAQDHYRLYHGAPGYITVYARALPSARFALEGLLASGVLQEDGIATLEELLRSWRAEPGRASPSPEAELALPPDEGFMAACATLSRGLIPDLMTFLAPLAYQELAKTYFWQFLRARQKLIAAIESRLPTYSLIERYMDYTLTDLQKTLQAVEPLEATHTITLSWLLAEEEWLRGALERLRRNAIGFNDPPRSQDMDPLKSHSNAILEVFEHIARRCGAERKDHLTIRWY